MAFTGYQGSFIWYEAMEINGGMLKWQEKQ
jgi:hypothetical protein